MTDSKQTSRRDAKPDATPGGAEPPVRDTGDGAGNRHLHTPGDRLGKQLDENQSQSDRNPGEGANRDPPEDS